jgi:hypothetical protein
MPSGDPTCLLVTSHVSIGTVRLRSLCSGGSWNGIWIPLRKIQELSSPPALVMLADSPPRGGTQLSRGPRHKRTSCLAQVRPSGVESARTKFAAWTAYTTYAYVPWQPLPSGLGSAAHRARCRSRQSTTRMAAVRGTRRGTSLGWRMEATRTMRGSRPPRSGSGVAGESCTPFINLDDTARR